MKTNLKIAQFLVALGFAVLGSAATSTTAFSASNDAKAAKLPESPTPNNADVGTDDTHAQVLDGCDRADCFGKNLGVDMSVNTAATAGTDTNHPYEKRARDILNITNATPSAHSDSGSTESNK